MTYQLYWGDLHTQFSPSQTYGGAPHHLMPKPEYCECWQEFVEVAFQEAAEYIDIFGFVYYPAFGYAHQGVQVESVGMRPGFAEDFEYARQMVKNYNDRGRLVTFLGYEWTGDRTCWGDHNVFYFDDNNPLDLTMDLPGLYANLRQRQGIAIPHHTGYQVGERGKDWDCWDEELSPFAEIFSLHGSSEGCNTPFSMNPNASMAPRVSGGTIQDGLARGYRLGIIASGDNPGGFPGQWGTGLMGVYAEELTREAVWEAFKQRRVYAVTGDRIRLEFGAKDCFMGQVSQCDGPPDLHVAVVGTQALDRIELIRNNRVIHSHCHNGSWQSPPPGQRTRVKLPVEFGWGPIPSYGFATQVHHWEGQLTVSSGALHSIEGCFSYAGNRVRKNSDADSSFHVVTEPRAGSVVDTCRRQTIVFEIEGDSATLVQLAVNGKSYEFSLGDLMTSSRVCADYEQVKQNVRDQFGLTEAEIENRDVYWHNAYKVKVHHAIPQAGYTASFDYRDEAAPSGRNFYYVRVSQLNGQMAWSSPVWAER